MYLKGVPFFKGREGLDRRAEPPRIKLWYVAPLGVKHDKNRGNFFLFTKRSSQNS